MVLRVFIAPVIALIGLSLASSLAIAEAPKADSSRSTIEQDQKTVGPLSKASYRSALERWRGKPYLRSSSDETLRSYVLDKTLPPANPAFQGGASLNVPVR
jgi:hypothetical protein